jgi:hypothetical protein
MISDQREGPQELSQDGFLVESLAEVVRFFLTMYIEFLAGIDWDEPSEGLRR